jgi:hypothetical protein
VAAGALAFQGVESLLGGFGHSAGFGGGSGFFGGGGGEGRPEETVINNYYDDSGREHGRVDDTSLGDSGSDAANLQNASDDLKDDGGYQDDSSLDDTSYDDSSFDDSSGGDDLV